VVAALRELVSDPERVSDDARVTAEHGSDISPHAPRPPDAVVFPDSSAEIAAILGWANAEGVPVVRPERFSGSRRAANARNRVYAIVHNSNVKRPAEAHA
jgi:FAD/FMN-containing dehydrogenase